MNPRLVALSLFISRKVLGVVVTLFVLASAVFVLLQLVPGDEAVVAAGPGATPAQVERVREQLGLAGGFLPRYWHFLAQLASGNLGTSSVTQGPVSSEIAQALPITAELVVVSILISVAVGVPLAALSAFRATGHGDSGRRFLVVLAAGMPAFWLALMAQWILGDKLRLLPISGTLSTGVSVPAVTGSSLLDSLLAGNLGAFWNAFQHILLPAAVLAIPFIGLIYRILRAEFIRTARRDHVTVARAAGLSNAVLLRRNVLPHVISPLLILVALEFGGLFGGAVLVESVFGRNGLGDMLTNAVAQKDTSTVVGGVLVIGLIVVLANLVVDVVQVLRDPRLRAAELGL
jgi:dipeptide transport system permease protein